MKKTIDGEKKKKRPPLKSAIISALRRLWRHSDQYHACKNANKVEVLVTYVKGELTSLVSPMIRSVNAIGSCEPVEIWPTFEPFTVPADWSPRNGRRVMFRCKECGRYFFENTTLPTPKGAKDVSMMAVDHVIPVVLPSEGFVDWNHFIANLFDGPMQLLCNYPGEIDGQLSCHAKKTKIEQAERTLQRRVLKKKQKETK